MKLCWYRQLTELHEILSCMQMQWTECNFENHSISYISLPTWFAHLFNTRRRKFAAGVPFPYSERTLRSIEIDNIFMSRHKWWFWHISPHIHFKMYSQFAPRYEATASIAHWCTPIAHDCSPARCTWNSMNEVRSCQQELISRKTDSWWHFATLVTLSHD